MLGGEVVKHIPREDSHHELPGTGAGGRRQREAEPALEAMGRVAGGRPGPPCRHPPATVPQSGGMTAIPTCPVTSQSSVPFFTPAFVLRATLLPVCTSSDPTSAVDR